MFHPLKFYDLLVISTAVSNSQLKLCYITISKQTDFIYLWVPRKKIVTKKWHIQCLILKSACKKFLFFCLKKLFKKFHNHICCTWLAWFFYEQILCVSLNWICVQLCNHKCCTQITWFVHEQILCESLDLI